MYCLNLKVDKKIVKLHCTIFVDIIGPYKYSGMFSQVLWYTNK